MKKLINAGFSKLGFQLISKQEYNRLQSMDSRPKRSLVRPEAKQEYEKLIKMRTEFLSKHPDSPYHKSEDSIVSYLNPNRIESYFRMLDLSNEQGLELKGKKLADIGSYFPYLFYIIENYVGPAEMHAYDTSKAPLELSDVLCPSAKTVVTDIFHINPEEEKFDVLFLTEVLEHLVNPQAALELVLKMLKPGGKALVTVPQGRLDNLPAKKMFSNGNSYQGHVNLWTMESWNHFIERSVSNIGGKIVSSGEEGETRYFAVIQKD